jgi:hypothetical protein
MNTKTQLWTVLAAVLLALLALSMWVWSHELPAASGRGVADSDSAPAYSVGLGENEGRVKPADDSAGRDAVPALETPRAAEDAPRTSWSGRLVARDSGAVLEGVTVRLLLLSPDAENQEEALLSRADGEVGPLVVQFSRFPAAELTVDPGPHWAGLRRMVAFSEGQAVDELIELAPPATVSVRVVDLARKRPVAGARVTAEATAGVVASSETDATGLARIEWTARGGPFVLAATAEGFSAVSEVELQAPPAADVTYELLLAPRGVLRAYVVDQDGRRLEGARVTARLIEGALQSDAAAEGQATRAARWVAPREEEGAFVFDAPCNVFIALRAAMPDGRAGTAFAKIAPPPNAADVRITVADSNGVEVWAFDETGSPRAGVTIGLDTNELANTDESGRAVVALESSKTGGELWAFQIGRALAWQEWDAELTEVVFRVLPEATVEGTVVDSSSRPQRNVRVTPLIGPRADGRGARSRRGELVTAKLGKRSAGTDSTGAFALRALPSGHVDLLVRPPRGSPFEVRDVPTGTTDLRIELLDEVTFGRSRGIALTLTVLDADTRVPIEGAAVTVYHVPDAVTKQLTSGRTGSTARDGRVRVVFPDEGDYTARVLLEGRVPHIGDVIGYPQGEHDVEIRLESAAELHVSVVDAGNAGMSGYWVSAHRPNGETVQFAHVEQGGLSSSSESMTDVNGRIRANGMRPGTVELEVRKTYGRKGPPLVHREVELEAGGKVELTLMLP